MSQLPVLFKNSSGATRGKSSWSSGFSRAPAALRSLISIVQEWEKKAHSGGLNSARDLDVATTGMTGTTPVPYVHLFDVIEYGETQQENQRRYNKIIDIVRVSLRGIIFDQHSHRSEVRYKGAFRNAGDMLKTRTVNPGSDMEAAICEELKVAIKLTCSPGYTSGDEYENEALVYALHEYTAQPGPYTANAGKAAEDAVVEVYEAMSPERKGSFNEYIKRIHEKEFLKYIQKLLKRAKNKPVRIGAEQSSLFPAIELS